MESFSWKRQYSRLCLFCQTPIERRAINTRAELVVEQFDEINAARAIVAAIAAGVRSQRGDGRAGGGAALWWRDGHSTQWGWVGKGSGFRGCFAGRRNRPRLAGGLIALLDSGRHLEGDKERL